MRLSVLVAAYNGEKYIREQLQSIYENIGPNDEVIISDDGSKDNTVAIVREFVNLDSRFCLVKGPGKGVVQNIDNLMRIASGDIIFLSDQDDIWKENKVNTIIRIFDENPDVTCVLHDMTVSDESLKTIEPSFFAYRGSRKGILNNIKKNSYVGAAMAFRSSLNNVVLPIPKFVPMHDQWIGLMHEHFGTIYFCSDKLITYRRHFGTATELHHGSLLSMISKRVCLIVALIIRIYFSK